MPSQYVVRMVLDRSLAVEDLSVTAYEDENALYKVVPGYGPFDTWKEAMDAVQRGLDAQLTLW